MHSLVVEDDESHDFFLRDEGWTNKSWEACNFNPLANIDNGSCVNCAVQDIEGFTYRGTFEGSHYYAPANPLPWIEADELCSSLGGYLVSISSQEENNWIYDNIYGVI